MDVIEVGISQMHENPATRRVTGVVTLLTAGRHIVFQCQAEYPADGRNRAALVQDALRQLSRMPEYRHMDRPLRCRLVAA